MIAAIEVLVVRTEVPMLLLLLLLKSHSTHLIEVVVVVAVLILVDVAIPPSLPVGKSTSFLT